MKIQAKPLFLLTLVIGFILLLVRGAEAEGTPPYTVYLPLIGVTDSSCSLPNETYSTLAIVGDPTDRPAAQHPDLNLALRGYVVTAEGGGLIDVAGAYDALAPQLYRLFGDLRTPAFAGVGQVYDWDWPHMVRGNPITYPEVTIAGLGVQKGEAIRVPGSGYNIGNGYSVPPPGQVFTNDKSPDEGYEVLVLYADSNRITLKYTREDTVVRGYTLHVEEICVEPRLLALYQQMNAAGRTYLPALKASQAFGTATGEYIGVIIRDKGSFMDPRSRKDWWRGR